jgi:hypothetical protein
VKTEDSREDARGRCSGEIDRTGSQALNGHRFATELFAGARTLLWYEQITHEPNLLAVRRP